MKKIIALILSATLAFSFPIGTTASEEETKIQELEQRISALEERVLILENLLANGQSGDSGISAEVAQTGEAMILGAGIYVVGEDIAEGKYDFTATSGGGTIYIYESFETYNSDELWDKYFHLGAEGTEYIEEYSDMYSISASNIRLTNGKCLVIESGLEIQVTPK